MISEKNLACILIITLMLVVGCKDAAREVTEGTLEGVGNVISGRSKNGDPILDATKAYAPRAIKALFKRPDEVKFLRDWRVEYSGGPGQNIVADSSMTFGEAKYAVKVHFLVHSQNIDVEAVLLNEKMQLFPSWYTGAMRRRMDESFLEDLPPDLREAVSIPSESESDALFKSTVEEQLRK